MIRDRIFFGIKDPDLKDNLLTMSNLTTDKAEEVYKTEEATKQETQKITASSEVYMVYKYSKTKGSKGKNITKDSNKWSNKTINFK